MIGHSRRRFPVTDRKNAFLIAGLVAAVALVWTLAIIFFGAPSPIPHPVRISVPTLDPPSHALAVEQRIAVLEIPYGFHLSLYALDVPGARSLAPGPEGVVFVGSRKEGNVYAMVDANGDFRAERVLTIATGLQSPNGVAYHDGALYVAEISRILRYDDIAARLEDPPEPVVVRDDLPIDGHHGWKFIRFGPDGYLYVPVGAPCNVCLRVDDERFASILRMRPDGSDLSVFARGVRNTVGFDWNPDDDVLWFTDNGRDLLGDTLPPDELNSAPFEGLHFGFPFCHGRAIADPKFSPAIARSCDSFELPRAELQAHAAALGMRFYNADQFPERYRGGIFFAQHGSWNSSVPVGYRVSFIPVRDGCAQSPEIFIEGWLRAGEKTWGRPVDVAVLPDGSLLISDDAAGLVYRVHHSG